MPLELQGVLADICANKAEEVAALLTSNIDFKRANEFGPVRDFYAALSAPGKRFIMECKRVSPSQGTLRASFSLIEIAAAYDGIADVVSVLTDEKYFGGHLSHLCEVRQRVSAPVLRKDFVLNPIQVREAWAHGADAVLLMLSVLTDAEYRQCAAEADAFGLGILTEVHTEAELQRALALNARVIGINNRDLRSLQIDLATTEKLARLIPADRIVVSESGIRDHDDVKRLAPHAKAFLVGSSLMSSDSVALAARELVFGKVKICGLTRPQDAETAFKAGAVYGGLIFAEGSKRKIEPAQAANIMHAAPLRYVGVFAGQTIDEISSLQTQLGLHAIQLHGDYSLAQVQAVKQRCPQAEVWQVQRITEQDRVETIIADRLLLDSGHGGQLGGNGTRFDWRLLHHAPDRKRLVLAGGLAPENISEAAATGAGLLDVNSGVERAPGIKDSQKLTQLFQGLRTNQESV